MANLFKKVFPPKSPRIAWVIDKMKSRKSVLVVGAPEGPEIQALLKKCRKVSVFLSEPKAKIPKAKYVEYTDEQYDYFVLIGFKPRYLLSMITKDSIKATSEFFMMTPAGNGSKDRSRQGMIHARAYQDLQGLVDKPSVVVFARHGEIIDTALAVTMSAVKGREFVQEAWLHFKED